MELLSWTLIQLTSNLFSWVHQHWLFSCWCHSTKIVNFRVWYIGLFPFAWLYPHDVFLSLFRSNDLPESWAKVISCLYLRACSVHWHVLLLLWPSFLTSLTGTALGKPKKWSVYLIIRPSIRQRPWNSVCMWYWDSNLNFKFPHRFTPSRQLN